MSTLWSIPASKVSSASVASSYYSSPTSTVSVGASLLNSGAKVVSSFQGDTQGDVYVSLRDRGEKAYKALCRSKNLTIETIYYCQEAIIGLQREARSLVNHDFLVIEIQDAGKSHYILAEKIGFPKEKAGIHISWSVKTLQEVQKVCTMTLNCRAKHLGFEQIVEILKDFNPDYNLGNCHCGHYAKAVAKSLLQACQSSSETNDGEKKRLQKEVEKVDAFVPNYSFDADAFENFGNAKLS